MRVSRLFLSAKMKFSYCIVVVLVSLLLPAVSQAEFYIAGMGGYVFPNDLSDISENSSFGNRNIPNFPLQNAPMGGGKIGYFFPQINWLGVETEGYLTEPKFEIPILVEGSSKPDFALQVATWAFNAIVRYPGTRFQPYGGVGLGVFFFRQTPAPIAEDTNWVPGLNVLAGFRTYLTEDKNLALFAEYKYNYVNYDFTVPFDNQVDFTSTYSANIAAGGISFHFDISP